MRTLIFLLAALWFTGARADNPAGGDYDRIHVDAPFAMPDIAIWRTPARDFTITDYGAQPLTPAADFEKLAAQNAAAFTRAMRACSESGGGRVVVPKGEWPTGPVHFESYCTLYLSEGSVLRFSGSPQSYLPAVEVSWEGLECYNYSPLIYAYRCRNIGIAGSGLLKPEMETWKTWFARPAAHMAALKKLYDWGSFDYPVARRQMAEGANNLRPHLIHFNQCEGVCLDGFSVSGSPFWTIHMYRCRGGVARRLNVYAHGHNNDGIDLEMTKNFLVEDCTFDQGDDGIVIKAGRNQDAWRVGCPTENIVVRRCHIREAHGLLVVGSEISGGIRNVYMTDCSVDSHVKALFYIKTNRRRGAVIDNITMENCTAAAMDRAFAIDTDVLYQWKDLVPTYKDSVTQIRNITMSGVRCGTVGRVYDINGDKDLPVSGVTLSGITVDRATDPQPYRKANVEGFKQRNIILRQNK